MNNEVSRRDFLAAVGAAAAILPTRSLGALPVRQQPSVLVPADKGHTKKWLDSLAARGKPTVYTGAALERIGMPIGGICCGQLYLSGDGRLWHWDIFNLPPPDDLGPITTGKHYSEPQRPAAPFGGFSLSVAGKRRELSGAGFADVRFTGKYPIAEVEYRDPSCAAQVVLEAFSPFIPLNADDSGLPATILNYTVKNTSKAAMDVEVEGSMANPVCLKSRETYPLRLTAQRMTGVSGLQFGARAVEKPSGSPDIVFADFEKERYEGWTVTGTAFGPGPYEVAKMAKYQGEIGGEGARVVNTHNTRNGENVQEADRHVGTLTSPAFTIERPYITFLIGGGNHAGQTCMNLLVDGKVARTATGRDDNHMQPSSWNVRDLIGKTATIQIVDDWTGGWGNIGVDDIRFSDGPRTPNAPLEDQGDFGDFALASASKDALVTFAPAGTEGKVTWRRRLKPGESATATFVVAWRFPNPLRAWLDYLQESKTFKHHYAKRFPSAAAVAGYVLQNMNRLAGQTRLWTQTWYDSSLPYWFLDRTFANTSILATSTCYRFDNGRFYGWEGIYCCAGTCTHVWQYAHAVARLFPELERDTRERVDYGIALNAETGAMGHRAEATMWPAVDGQCGTILRVYREHQMSKDDTFLKRLWPRVKRSIEWLIKEDANDNGILEGSQWNTLDASWNGRIAWLSGMYVAVLRAGVEMAADVGDSEFARRCRALAERGTGGLDDLYNGEYYIHKVDPSHPETINTNDGCHIDQVYGQAWAHQVGLARIFPLDKCRSALAALYRYNFSPDVGAYRKQSKIKGGRWYALPGEAGLLMCTWPRGGVEKAPGTGQADFAVGYFNECMSGFEHQVAGHMLWDGLTQEGLAIERAIHDRYSATRRNPYNEIECSDHYARAMASYGVFLAACGYEYHGPKKHLGFAPRLSPDDFSAAFTAADGWGKIKQKRASGVQENGIYVKWGQVALRSVAIESDMPKELVVKYQGHMVDAKVTRHGVRTLIRLEREVTVKAGEALTIEVKV